MVRRRVLPFLLVVCLFAMCVSVASGADSGASVRTAAPPLAQMPNQPDWDATAGIRSQSTRIVRAGTIGTLAVDDEIPGLPVTASPIFGNVDEVLDEDDVYFFYMEQGQTLYFSLDVANDTQDIDLYLFGSGATDVDTDVPLQSTAGMTTYPRGGPWTAVTSGYYYIDVYAHAGSSDYTLTVSRTGDGPNDDISGVDPASSEIIDFLDKRTSGLFDNDDVYRVYLNAGQVLYMTLESAPVPYASADADFDLYLFGPTATTVDNYPTGCVASNFGAAKYKTLQWTATTSGWHYVDVYASSGQGLYRLTQFTPSMAPVYRFYNMRQGVHFYTAGESEKNHVIANFPSLLRYEGVAYNVDAASPDNDTPLYRFYNVRQGVHFYTASESERDYVIANFPSLLRYEGPAYNVSASSAGGATPVYRFYHLQKGVHFYTASESEKNFVVATYPSIYRLEGVSFFLAP